ncbi:unnamed protein product [Linum trigynum]|uniref:Uncharacterized protein n=1 Tax=Linum trigynum TaxID=586398 RepID=A0AAV2FGJ8_9ROSI
MLVVRKSNILRLYCPLCQDLVHQNVVLFVFYFEMIMNSCPLLYLNFNHDSTGSPKSESWIRTFDSKNTRK